MKGDIPQAAFRLSTSLPCRTIERKQAPRKVNEGNPNVKRGRPLTVIFGKGGKARPVVVYGITYESATTASRMLHKSTAKIYEWLRDGTARYA